MANRLSCIGLVLAVAVGALFWAGGASSQETFVLSVRVNHYAGPTPLQVRFSATTRGGSGTVRYRWCFDDGTDSQDRKPTRTFERAGYYKVSVRARDESGTEVSKSVLLGVWPPKQWAQAQRKPITKEGAARAQRVQQRRTRKRRKQLQRRHGLTRSKCIHQQF